MSLNQTLHDLNAKFSDTDQRMPALFVGHGSPMNAIEDNDFSRAWAQVGKSLPKPNAILCISAHWETAGTLVTGMDQPKTIHDFGGFPPELYEMEYPAPGSRDLAKLTVETVKSRCRLINPGDWTTEHGRSCAGCFRAPISQ
jgi:4,5-DOPA dioxygenase extradiol